MSTVQTTQVETAAMDRSPSVPLSRGLKIEDLASNVATDDQSDASRLFSREALSHAVSGSVGGNIAMLGARVSSCSSQLFFALRAAWLCIMPRQTFWSSLSGPASVS